MEAPASCLSVKRKFLWEVNEEEEENSVATQILEILKRKRKLHLYYIFATFVFDDMSPTARSAMPPACFVRNGPNNSLHQRIH